MPWDGHSSSWEVPWDDRYENAKVVTLLKIDENGKEVTHKEVGNPKKMQGTILKVEDSVKREAIAAAICLGFWSISFYLFINYIY